jgi:hypothetical protein
MDLQDGETVIGKRIRVSPDTRKLIHYISVLYDSSGSFLREVEGYYGQDYIGEHGPVRAVADYLTLIASGRYWKIRDEEIVHLAEALLDYGDVMMAGGWE